VGPLRHEGLLPHRRRLQRVGVRVLPVPDGVHGHDADHPHRRARERWKFSSFCIFTVFLGAIIYPVFGNWAWGGGWLSALGRNVGLGNGYVDFAGSGVVHLTGGVIALVTCKLLGPRRGKFNADGSANVIPGHNIPMAIYGTFVLAFGWFGFNAGSTLAGTDVRIGVVATNTMLAGAAGAVSAMAWVWMKYGKPDPSMLANGMLAGLVAITAPCAFVTAPSAVVIGLIAGPARMLGSGVLREDAQAR
jgi:Amt family ammonium transporter